MKGQRNRDLALWLRPTFYTIGLLGTCQTWGRFAVDGSLVRLLKALHNYDYVLPGTEYKASSVFTGIYWPVDHLIRLLVLFWWEVLDGSHPTTSAIGIYFLFQHFGGMTAAYTDSLRKGSATSVFRTSLWFLLWQFTAIGCTGWIWALSCLLSTADPSPTSISDLRILSTVTDAVSVFKIPAALFLGYFIPALLMALVSPSVVTNTFQQYAIAGWNVFPVFVFLAYLSLSVVPKRSSENWPRLQISHLSAIRINNSLALFITFTSHIAISTLSVSTTIFPSIFAPNMVKALVPSAIFIPPLEIQRGSTIGDGVRSFCLWDEVFGYLVVSLVMFIKLKDTMDALGKNFEWVKATLITLVVAIVAGPGSACLLLNWARDEVLFSHQDA